ncbi:Fe-S protein assembly chaperone HscA [Oxalobacter aliiformigenes]|uniref:Chaperone protein HscA homolog n=1 Tax=Oxalobacter aliiformigenes TaxID=2946593 RepID=A0ABY7JH62_9BURK|nr:Fe-S protein assembly chaperone HscA [Oxalobacter aliiformigenes]WAV93253.1 Fe-S protein assembly chaperone HscA [Oxalobacter aliiformigenes]WAV95244.1 Fe-S protein assembly chaperone HscA [Oxalobacter aliiformigenes]WAV96955.1 Fe-S protein assembly chaperone HscA [Oxalobacter aliiformigenes]
MALLQIAEPGMSVAPHQFRLAVGIDLGTTHSLVATVRNSIPEVLEDESQRPLLPSVVRYFPDSHTEVGYEAKLAQNRDPKNTIASVKRLMGRGLKDIANRESLPYQFVDTPGMVRIETTAGQKSPVEVSAEILSVLKHRAEEAFDEPLAGAVITVPAYFDDAQRQATKDAAKLAGIHVLRLLSEPTAAAIAYGLDNASEGIYAAYDLGGGTFDISILKLNKGVFEVLATGGDSRLGGDDFDHRIFCWIIEKAHLKPLSAEDTQLLMTKAREAKERLSARVRVTVNTLLCSGEKINLELTAKVFEQMTHPLVCRTMQQVKKTIRDAGISIHDINGIILIGGATRMPHVRRQIQKLFGKKPHATIDPEKVVALGAAMQANLLAGNRAPGDDWLLLDVTPLSLGIETMGGLVEKIIPRNSTIPCTYAQEFTTFKDGQTALAIHVLQGERELVDDCRSLARFELRGIPPMAAGVPRIRITFQVDADGLLSVSARETHSGTEASITVKPSYGLTDKEIAAMLEESGKNAETDMQERALREERVEAERTIQATETALETDGDLLNETERTVIKALIAATRETLQGHSVSAIHEAIEALSRGTENFAAKRMNRSIKKALSGKTVNNVI